MNDRDSRRARLRVTSAWVALAMLGAIERPPAQDAAIATQAEVSIVVDRDIGPGTRHGLRKLVGALETRRVRVARVATVDAALPGSDLVVAGLATGSGAAAKWLRAEGIEPPRDAESLLIRRSRRGARSAFIICGADDRGLMYALLDTADRVGWAADSRMPLSEVRDARQSPYVSDRALSLFTFHRARFERLFHDEAFWAAYLDTLARNRFNTFVLIFGYENWGYFSPPYPYFFDVDGFPDVRVVGITPEEQQRNLKSLRRVIAMTHERGLDFTIGIWDHIYRGGVQGPTERARQPTEGIAWGLTADNLRAYTRTALAKWLRELPEIDAIQFRMHGESGLRRGEMREFWSDIYRVVQDIRPGLRFDARAKNFPHELIDLAVDRGIDIRICTKYWMEQMGMPFHPTHVHPRNQHDRRHGYADLLRYPRRYPMHWRLWNGGTSRLLLWADPVYARRFAASTHLYDGEGFEVNEPLSTKMQDQPHDAATFNIHREPYRHYRWEFERYWHYFQVFGRLGYDPDTPSEVWEREFERRFGAAGPFVERALHRASQVLPRAVAYSHPYKHFPMTRGWVARQRQEDLPAYAKALPSDTEQFLSMDDAARHLLAAEDSAKIWPAESSRWFARAANDVLEFISEAEARVDDRRGREFECTIVDLKILAHLARYHSWRALAGQSYALFARAGDLASLDDAIRFESNAIAAWERIVTAAGDVYDDDLRFGRRSADLCGHWRDELAPLRRGLEALRARRREFTPRVEGNAPSIVHVPVRRVGNGTDVEIRATVGAKTSLEHVRALVVLGDAASRRPPPRVVTLTQSGPHVYSGVIPLAWIATGSSYSIEAVEATGQRTTVPPTRTTVWRITATDDDAAPTVQHAPITRAKADEPLVVRARVSDASAVQSVRLRYRGVSQYEDYRTLEMSRADTDGTWAAEVPAEHMKARFDFMYFLEVIDTHGNGAIWPDLDETAPYVIVELER